MQRDGQYRGVSYRVESTPTPGGAYLGRYQLLDTGRRRHDATDHEFLGGGPAANGYAQIDHQRPPRRQQHQSPHRRFGRMHRVGG